MTSARGTGFDYRPSVTLTAFAAAILCLATVAPFLTSLPWYVRWPVAAIVAMGGTRRLQRFRQSPVGGLRLSPAGLWTVTVRGREVPAELAASRFFGNAVFLRLRWRGGAGHVALLPDNVPPDTLRRLRARLRSTTRL
ncbi:protein YgfX [Luteibacter yeojuensis]|uniref:Toxin CptA n=1 Tax=Luteibacter yeojuensis TaxID=345309 RepID=A0A7X5QSD7_9GAMM|nr:protein YgfX [Luteibacter yeojuensis]NID14442.1 hypothetical protein [Luteibacter yeojuensis]